LTLSDKPAINFQDHFDYLLRYPYGCLEQTISSTYPWLVIDNELFTEFDLAGTFNARFNQTFSDEFRRKQLEDGIDKLLNKQNSSGTFGYWHSNSHPSMWGTAYATELLVDAYELGVSFDKTRLNNALAALTTMVKGNANADIWTDNDTAYKGSFRAYAAYVLAKADQSNPSDLRRLFSQLKTASLSHSSLPWMHMAVAFNLTGDSKNAQEAAEKALTFQRAENQYYADYGSSVRDIALTLSLAIEHGLGQGNLGLDLEESLGKRRWYSTQERIALLRLAKAFLADGNEWQANLITDTLNQSIEKTSPFNTIINNDELVSIQSIEAGEQKVYATISWQGVPETAPTPYEKGMTINRQFYSLDGKRIDFKNPIKSGELIIARIDAQSIDYRFPEALVVDLLPAGLELENQNLLNASVNLDEIVIEDKNVGDYFRSYRVEYEEYRDDRYIAAISLTSWSPTTLFYLARAVTPGTYAFPNSYIEDMYRPENQAIGYTPGSITILAND